jgi:hypothetical protein
MYSNIQMTDMIKIIDLKHNPITTNNKQHNTEIINIWKTPIKQNYFTHTTCK